MKTKKELWSQAETEAQKFREDNPDLNLTHEQAIDRVMTAERYREYREAPDSRAVATDSPDPWVGRTAEKAVYDQITLKANERRSRNVELTEAQAFVEVWDQYPNVRTAYREAQARDRARQRQQKPAASTVVKTTEKAATAGQNFTVAAQGTKRTEARQNASDLPRMVIVHDSPKLREMAERLSARST